jgi:regulator of protease activity HflC (stomatin/prohibitin superfamily)
MRNTRGRNYNETRFERETTVSTKQISTLIASLMAVVLITIFGFNMFTTVEAGEVVVKQGAFDGKLEVWTQPGMYCRCFGKLTSYRKTDQYWFSKEKSEGKDESIKVRFNDGGHGNVSGSLSYNLPIDRDRMVKLHTAYGSMEAVEHRLIRQVVTKAVYMSGPFMTSRESSAERRPDLITFISEQIARGVYKTQSEEIKQLDVLSGQEKTVRTVKPVPDQSKPGNFIREESSPVEEFGIQVYNLTINNIDYDETVEKQIKAQQEALAAVQTQMAQARMAEQKLLTTQSEGKAAAEKAKWEQEVEKTKAITLAQQEKEVATLALETAKLQKQKEIALGEGEAARKKLVMEADGALAQKLDAWVKVNQAYADAMSKQPQVPSVVMGNSDSKSTSTADLLQLMAVRSARDLSVEVRPGK